MVIARVAVNVRSEEYRLLRSVIHANGLNWTPVQDEIAEAANVAATAAAREKVREIIERSFDSGPCEASAQDAGVW